MKIFYIFALFKVFQYRSVYQHLYYNILTNNCIATMIMEDKIVQEVINENLDVIDNNIMNDIHNKFSSSQNIESEERKDNKQIQEDCVNSDNDIDNEVTNTSDEPLLLLPPSLPTSTEDNIHEDRSMKLGEKISMEELGPIIVNTDGNIVLIVIHNTIIHI